jgi:hypothetical protein
MRSRSASAGFLFLGALLLAPVIARAEPPQHCTRTDTVLWGDGRHDDTFALNAWLRGEDVAWADSGDPVGDAITGHDFRLSSAIYVTAGSGRVLRDFRLLWPERHETVSGGTIISGTDPNKAPVSTGINIVGGDSTEGVAFDDPNVTPAKADPRASCATS